MSDIEMLLHDLEANLRMMEMADEEWVIQDGCSWRRIGTSTGRETDGTVLRPYVARDGHPDIQSAYGVLMHIRLSQPRNVRRLLDEITRLRQELAEARADCTRANDLINAAVTDYNEAVAEIKARSDAYEQACQERDEARAKALEEAAQIADRHNVANDWALDDLGDLSSSSTARSIAAAIRSIEKEG